MRTHAVVAGLLAGVLQVAGCGDSLEPGGALTEEERAALATALGLDGSIVHDWAVGTTVDLVPEIGRMGQYDALASQAVITFWDGTTPSTYGFTQVDGWTDFNPGASTVRSAISVHASFFEGSFPSSISTIVYPDVTVSEQMRATFVTESRVWVATDGELHLNASGFGDFEDCPENPHEDWADLDFVSCRYSFGTITGSFRFDASLRGSSAVTFREPSISVPAVRVEIELRRSDAAS